MKPEQTVWSAIFRETVVLLTWFYLVLQTGCGLDILPLLQVSQHHSHLVHKLGAVTHEANILQLNIDRIAQLASNVLPQQDDTDFFRRGSYLSETADRVNISSWPVCNRAESSALSSTINAGSSRIFLTSFRKA